jgi:lipoprotein signal peptidase
VKKRTSINLLKCFWPILLLILCQGVSALVVINDSVIINNKVFFGLVLGNSWAIFFSLLVVVAILIYQTLTKKLSVLLCLIAAAVFSNILDRILHGGVVDYFSYQKLPSFNLADVVIVMSVTYLSFLVITQKNAQL